MAGLVSTAVLAGAVWYFNWLPPSGEVFWLLIAGASAVFYLYLIAIRRCRVVTLIDRQLIWNTYGWRVPPLTVQVTDITAYRIGELTDTHLCSGAVLLPTGWQKVGDFPEQVHRRIFSRLQVLRPDLRWEEQDFLGNHAPSPNPNGNPRRTGHRRFSKTR